MTNIIVAFPKIENARSIKGILVQHGYNVIAVCHSGSYVIQAAESQESCIIISGLKLNDMMYTELRENIPQHMPMIVVTSPANWGETSDSIVFEPLPLSTNSLFSTIEMIIETSAKRSRKKKLSRNVKPNERPEEEKKLIEQAKGLLMSKNGMTENDAHKYMQKKSMESGNSLVETAEMIMLLYK